MAHTPQGLGLRVKGVVQGVGFRPFVFRLAKRLGLTGSVRNTGEGVYIEIYGKKEALEEFSQKLKEEAPPLASIEKIESQPLNGPPPPLFTVLESESQGKATRLPPDVATCEACLQELFDPLDRRYRYPFINCTDCGPRFTVIEDLPYDREKTTMKRFPMCRECLAEYSDPENRRFHAEPNACPCCGPRIWLTDREGRPLSVPDPLKESVRLLKEGKILAIKGLGGFHLAVDALNEAACQALRQRKHRPAKPLALMVPDLEAARSLAYLHPEEEKALISRTRPIVLVRQRPSSPLAPSIAPGLSFLGLMLPYTPLHHLLLREGGFLALVMTSGNPSGLPLCFRNEEALEQLREIADFFLLHDREIVIGIDDSVVRLVAGKIRPLRRARGLVPEPLPFPQAPSILAVGPHLKNTFCLTREKEAYVSQHLGDLENLETERFFWQVLAHFEHLLETKPQIIACDLHPGYLSTQIAEKLARESGLPLFRVPHHVAHAAAVMGEFDLSRVLALCLDGLGLGPDHTLWGGELLWVERGRFQRLGHLLPVPQAGGDAASRQPWRLALAYLHLTYGEEGFSQALKIFAPRISEEKIQVVLQMIKRKINAPLTTSCGRLLDACAALLDLADENRYEGEAPMKLESLARAPHRLYETPVRGEILDPRPLIKGLLEDLEKGLPRESLAAAVLVSLARGLARLVLKAAQKTGLREVVLAGGCFQNAILTQELKDFLEGEGLLVYLPEKVPVNDGGVSYGQTWWAAWSLKR